MALPAAVAGRAATGASRAGVRNAKRHTAAGAPRVSKAYARRGTHDQTFDRTVARTARTQRIVRNTRTSATAQTGMSAVATYKKKARAVRMSLMIASLVLPLCGIQLLFGLLQLGGYGAESAGEQILWGLGATVLPGTTLFAAGWIVAAVLGIGTMVTAAAIYAFSGVAWWRGSGGLYFSLFLILSMAPFSSMVPWLAIWIPIVIYTQK